MKICYSGIRFFYEHVIHREWHIFKILKSQKEKRLPYVLGREETYAVLGHIHTFHNYVYLASVFACGLRDHPSFLSLLRKPALPCLSASKSL